MKKRILIVVGILIAAGAIGAGAWYYFRGSKNTGTGDSVTYVSTVSSLTGDAAGAMNRFAGVVEPQETVEVEIENGRKVKEVRVKTGEEVKKGQLLFEYDLSSIQEDLQQSKLDLDRLKNEANSLKEQIAELTKEKKKAKADSQLSYTIEIETNKMNLKKNEYDQKSKSAEIDKLQNATVNTEVRSEIDGVIQKIDASKMSSDDGDIIDEGMNYMSMGNNQESNAFITILSTGAYRIKGKVNELNRNSLMPGEPLVIRSRVDSTQTWKGTMGEIDTQNGSSDNGDNMGYWGMMSANDEQTTSTSYPFYVELESSEGLMLGQHVYIERDQGQADVKEGLWLSDIYIVDADTADPYVWAANDKNRLEKRYVVLGRHDEELGEYEIADGLTKQDCIAFPTELLTEGSTTEIGDISQTMSMGADMNPDDYVNPAEGDTDMMINNMDGMDAPAGVDDMVGMDDMSGFGDGTDNYEAFPDDELIPMDGAPGMEDSGTMDNSKGAEELGE